jgi:hypothetical protein
MRMPNSRDRQVSALEVLEHVMHVRGCDVGELFRLLDKRGTGKLNEAEVAAMWCDVTLSEQASSDRSSQSPVRLARFAMASLVGRPVAPAGFARVSPELRQLYPNEHSTFAAQGASAARLR